MKKTVLHSISNRLMTNLPFIKDTKNACSLNHPIAKQTIKSEILSVILLTLKQREQEINLTLMLNKKEQVYVKCLIGIENLSVEA